MGFTGPEQDVATTLGAALGETGTISVDSQFATTAPGIFACGDAVRGQSLVVWAIAEGRSAAAAVDRWLMGETTLPEPVRPDDRPLR